MTLTFIRVRVITVALTLLLVLVGAESAAAPPANDSFSNRIVMTSSGGNFSGSNVGATKESNEPVHAGNSGNSSVWWQWTPTDSGSATITTGGSSFDTLLAVYTGTSVSSLTVVASNDDFSGNSPSSTSRVTFNVSAGTSYKIAVDGYNINTGSIALTVTPPPVITSGSINVSVNGVSSGDVNAVILFRGDYQEVDRKTSPSGTSALFSSKAFGTDYLAQAYCWDMHVGETSVFNHSSATTTVTINSTTRRPITLTAYYSDGVTKLEGATVKLDSWNGQTSTWSNRNTMVTDANGNAPFLAWPTKQAGEKYRFQVLVGGVDVASLDSVVVVDNVAGSSYSLTTSVTPGGTVSVSVNGVNPGDINASILYRGNYQKVDEKTSPSGTSFSFSNKAFGTDYLVDAYCWDMQVGITGPFTHSSANTPVLISAKPRRPANVTVYYSDGSTRFGNATVQLDSWNGQTSAWITRDTKTTDASGNASFSAWPTTQNGEKYRLRVFNGGAFAGEKDPVTIDNTTSGSSYSINTAAKPVEIIGFNPPSTSQVARGTQLQATVQVKNNTTTARSFWVGFSFAHESATENGYPVGYYDLEPLQTAVIQPGAAQTVTFRFAPHKNLRPGQYFARASVWDSFSQQQYKMVEPRFDDTLVINNPAHPEWTTPRDQRVGLNSFSLGPFESTASTVTEQLRDFAQFYVFKGVDLQTKYLAGQKPLYFFRAEAQGTVPPTPQTPSFDVAIGGSFLIDLADLFQITPEGRDGWVTVWVDGTLGLGTPSNEYSLETDSGIIYHTFDYSERALADDRRSLALDTTITLPGLVISDVGYNTVDGWQVPRLEPSGDRDFGIIVKGTTAGFRFQRLEVRLTALLNAFSNAENQFKQAATKNLKTFVGLLGTEIYSVFNQQLFRAATYDDGDWGLTSHQTEAPLKLSKPWNATDKYAHYFSIDVPSGTTTLTVESFGGTGNADLYLRFGQRVSSLSAGGDVYSSAIGANGEAITVSNPTPGKWFFSLATSSSYDGVQLRPRVETGSASGPPVIGRLAYHSYSDYLATPIDVNDGHIFILPLPSGPLRKLTQGLPVENAMNPHISPDGSRVTFMAIPQGAVPSGTLRNYGSLGPYLEIYTYDLSSEALARLTINSVPDEDPKFSPDGNAIVFKRGGQVWKMNADGSNPAQLTTTSDEKSGPNYSPDGANILYWSEAQANADVWRMPASGGVATKLVGTAGLSEYYPIYRDAQNILFTRWESSSDHHDKIYQYSTSSGLLQRLPINQIGANDSDSFPVNSSLVGFSSDRPGGKEKWDVYIANPTTGAVYPIPAANSGHHDLGGWYSPYSMARKLVLQAPASGTQVSGGATVLVTVRGHSNGGTWAGAAPKVVLQGPASMEFTGLHDDGIDGDQTPGDGTYSKSVTLPSQAGTYTMYASANSTDNGIDHEIRSTSLSVTIGSVPPPSSPNVSAATGLSSSGFTANWSSVSGATGYRLDVSTSSSFSGFVTGYQDFDAGDVMSKPITGLAANKTYYYRVRAYNGGGPSGNSSTITVTTSTSPTPAPVITSQPLAQTVNAGQNANFTVTATGAAPLSYQWQRNGLALANTGKYAGVQTATLTISSVTTNEVGTYNVVVTNLAGTATSSAATLTVNRLPQTITFPTIPTLTLGGVSPAPDELIAYSSSGRAVYYVVDDPTVAAVGPETGILTLLRIGTTTVSARQDGDATYLPADPVTRTLTVTSPPPGPVLNPANGHFYEFVPAFFTWSQARAEAEARVFTNGWRGHLATIQNGAENAFVTALVTNGSTVWIGGFQPAGSAEPAGGWRWVTEEPMGFTNWASGEPNQAGNEESIVLNGANYQNPGQWQDAPGNSLVGIVVEYEPPAVSFNPANGHYYEFVSLERNWSQARADAEARVLTNGWRGHLVTIQDAPENAFVTALVSNVAAVWIGGYQPGGSAEPAGGWRWSTSEALAFTNWAPGEPSDFGFGVNSDSILLNAVNVANAGQWRAASGNLPSPQFHPYLVEYEPTPNAIQVLAVSLPGSRQFIVSWPMSDIPYALESCTNLAGGPWIAIPQGNISAYTNNSIPYRSHTNDMSLPRRFYRLRYP